MKWNGTVSQFGQASIAARFATANAAHAASIGSGRCEAISRVANRLDRCVVSKLLPQAPHAYLDDVRPWVEVVSPDLREQALATDHLARMERELPQKSEFAV